LRLFGSPWSHCQFTDFTKLGIKAALTERLRDEFHITRPNSLQIQSIPAINNGKDLILKDNTGTGKSFTIIVALLSKHRREGIANLVVVPTREIAFQMKTWIRRLVPQSDFPTIDPVVQLCIKDRETEAQQEHTLRNLKPHILIGTPNRLLELYERNVFSFGKLNTLVLDEADKVLDPISKHATAKERTQRKRHPILGEVLVDHVFESRRPQRKVQLLCASATVNRSLKQMLTRNKWVESPLLVDAATLNDTGASYTVPATIAHSCFVMRHGLCHQMDAQDLSNIISQAKEESTKKLEEEEDKTKKLQKEEPKVDSYHEEWEDYVIEHIVSTTRESAFLNGVIFTPNSKSVARLIEKLCLAGLAASSVLSSSSLNPPQSSIFVTTRATCRGIDIPKLSHVFILGCPENVAEYVHMVGRTGRMNSQGFAFTFLADNAFDAMKMQTILKHLNVSLLSSCTQNMQHNS
jgi:superfamily II DNA/RNA helicase